MSKVIKYTAEQKYNILKEYENGTETLKKILNKYIISKPTFYNWKYRYNRYGLDGLKKSKSLKEYSKELKEQVVKDYLSGEYSQYELTEKYELSTKTMVQKWVKIYNSHRELKATKKGMSQSMTKGRSTSWKEKIEIVLYCIANNKDYQLTAEAHQVSYQQVYQWVKKYESNGEDALKDRRGRKKNEEELTQEEKFKLEMKKLKAENQKLKAENAFLKKLEELERRRF